MQTTAALELGHVDAARNAVEHQEAGTPGDSAAVRAQDHGEPPI
jgi:hypothetical protein